MKQSETVKQLTPEEQAIVRAYNAAYMREYRKKNRERLKAQAAQQKLKRATAAIAAGLLEDPNAKPAAATES